MIRQNLKHVFISDIVTLHSKKLQCDGNFSFSTLKYSKYKNGSTFPIQKWSFKFELQEFFDCTIFDMQEILDNIHMVQQTLDDTMIRTLDNANSKYIELRSIPLGMIKTLNITNSRQNDFFTISLEGSYYRTYTVVCDISKFQ